MRPDRGFDALAEHYDRRETLRGDPLERWLRASLPGGATAVDLACGAGRHAVIIAERYRDVLAVDLSEPMIALARRRRQAPNISYRPGDLLAVDGSFELVFCSSALHDVADLDGALRHIRSLVAPGGTAIVADVAGILPRRPAVLLRARAVAQLARDLLHRPRDALELYRLESEPGWVAHLASDRYLTRTAFERRCERHLPGASFARAGHLHVCLYKDRLS